MNHDPDPTLMAPLQSDQSLAVAANEPLRHRVWTVWVALAASFALIMIAQVLFVMGLFARFVAQGTPVQEVQQLLIAYMMTPPMFILMLFLGPGLFGLVALGAARLSPEPWRKRLGLVPVSTSRAIYPLSILGSLFPTAVGIGLAEALIFLVPQLPVDTNVLKLYEQMTPLWSIPFVILIGLVPGFCEEMFFRGYIQRRLVSRWRPILGVGITSLLFGLAHVMPAAVVMSTVIGVYLGVVGWKSGSIWPTIGCHLFINSSINFWRVVVIFWDVSSGVQTIVTWVAVAISAVCCIATLLILLRPRNAPRSESV